VTEGCCAIEHPRQQVLEYPSDEDTFYPSDEDSISKDTIDPHRQEFSIEVVDIRAHLQSNDSVVIHDTNHTAPELGQVPDDEQNLLFSRQLMIAIANTDGTTDFENHKVQTAEASHSRGLVGRSSNLRTRDFQGSSLISIDGKDECDDLPDSSTLTKESVSTEESVSIEESVSTEESDSQRAPDYDGSDSLVSLGSKHRARRVDS